MYKSSYWKLFIFNIDIMKMKSLDSHLRMIYIIVIVYNTGPKYFEIIFDTSIINIIENVIIRNEL